MSRPDPSPASGDRIRFDRVTKTFQTRGRAVEVLQPIDLRVRPEEFVALVGPSGCGKSTLLNMAAGLLQPTEGQVLYDGQPIIGPNRRVGYMTQKDTLLPWRNTVDNIGIALELKCRPTSRSEAADRVAQMIDLVGLRGFERHYPGELSGGMRKRVALARTLIYEPQTLLMDEPFGALDAQLKLLMHDQLQRLTSSRRITVLFVTHDLGEAIALADRVVVFSARPGRIRAVRDVPLTRPRDVFKVRFTEPFAHLNEELWDELQDEVVKGTNA
jgi:NitT/TauT family transport system ATP-binding protein